MAVVIVLRKLSGGAHLVKIFLRGHFSLKLPHHPHRDFLLFHNFPFYNATYRIESFLFPSDGLYL